MPDPVELPRLRSNLWIIATVIILSLFLYRQHQYQESASLHNRTFLDVIDSHSDLHNFNRKKLLPRIKRIVDLDYFRYVKVNLKRPCTLWCKPAKCKTPDCEVKPLSEKCPIAAFEDKNELSTVNTELASDNPGMVTFECNPDDDHDSIYVDLKLNPERYTGYDGEHAHRIWQAIYQKNCFVTQLKSPFSENLCFEERLFYVAISGLHTSISIHLCAEWPNRRRMPIQELALGPPISSIAPNANTFGPNLNEFLRRFRGHNDFIENLYELYRIELNALVRCKPYLTKRFKWPDLQTKMEIQGLLADVEECNMFDNLSLRPNHVTQELALHFRNITTTIIDCVACDKCKLWGKVQLRGLGAALKILSLEDLSTKSVSLNHQEVSSLINAIARLSHSLSNLERFKDLLLLDHSPSNIDQKLVSK